MPTTAAEIMNRDFLYASQGDSLSELMHEMAARRVCSTFVLDIDGRPVGVATLLDVESCHDVEELAERSARPALTLPQSTPIPTAARQLAARRAESLMLVNDAGVAVGALSALDLLCALVEEGGLSEDGAREGQEPPRLTQPDAAWSPAELLELSAAHRAPDAPGVILLSPGSSAGERRAPWAESSVNIRERLDEMLRAPQADPALEALLDVYPRDLRFRCLVVHDPERRERLARGLCRQESSA